MRAVCVYVRVPLHFQEISKSLLFLRLVGATHANCSQASLPALMVQTLSRPIEKGSGGSYLSP